MNKHTNNRIEKVGLIGLGLMGQGIASSLIANSLQVVAYSRTAARGKEARRHIDEALKQLVQREVIPHSAVADWQSRFTFVRSLEDLKDCPVIIETIVETLSLKLDIYDKLELVVPARTVIASNTSSIPISQLQHGRKHPERFIGMHWSEPAEITRYLEIIRGKQTSDEAVDMIHQLGVLCGKEPSVLNVDIQGFVSNRLMYAMMREACHLVETGVADIETVDRSFRNDIGWWSTIAGPFRWMDLTGIQVYATVMENLFPELSNSTDLPKMMKEKVESGAEGISNRKGFYSYTKASAREWEKVWLDFTHELRKLVEKYEKRVK